MCIGDISGQMTLIEVPKLFYEKVSEEENIMKQCFDNEIARKEYMKMRFKIIEEEINNNANAGDEKKEPENDIERELKLKYVEEAFVNNKKEIMRELGLEVPKTEEELEKERKAKEEEENNS